jgi:hypothetical protein
MRDVRDYSGFLASRGVKKRRMIVSLYLILIKGNSKEGARVALSSPFFCSGLLCYYCAGVGYRSGMTYVRGNTRMQRVGSGQAAPQNHLRNATVTLTATGTDASQRSRDPTLTRDKLHVH